VLFSRTALKPLPTSSRRPDRNFWGILSKTLKGMAVRAKP
jgi:hypothetical protein